MARASLYLSTAATHGSHLAELLERRRVRHDVLPYNPFQAGKLDPPFITHALDRDAGIWMLRVSCTGEAVLRLNECVMAIVSSEQGSALLRSGQCSFDSAANLIANVNCVLEPHLCSSARADMEFDLARWIGGYIDP